MTSIQMTSQGFFVDVVTGPLDSLDVDSSLRLQDFGALVIVDPEAVSAAVPFRCMWQGWVWGMTALAALFIDRLFPLARSQPSIRYNGSTIECCVQTVICGCQTSYS